MRGLVLILVTIIVMVPASRAQAQSPMISINPPVAKSGTIVTLRGTGFRSGESIFIFVLSWQQGRPRCGDHLSSDYGDSAELTADAQGTFVYTYRAIQRSADHLGYGFSVSLYPSGSLEECFLFDTGTSQTFPETGQMLSGRFYDFWRYNGGLPVYGYPITAARDEPNYDTGKTYLTQWFERNRFELHLENTAPYDVLLGRLGAERLQQVGRDWQAEGREAGPLPNCLWFPETGHNVCNQAPPIANDAIQGIRDYWQRIGLEFDGEVGISHVESLALWGLPLTQARVETNSSGDRVVTQWFERARFEWHGDRVLIGLLGREVAGIP
jgi:hypothetical protein